MNEIPQDQRTMAAFTHLSGLAGYIIPLGGAIVPILIWLVKKEDRLIATIAKQALWLNVIGFVLGGILTVAIIVSAATVILIPLAIVLGLVAFVLSIFVIAMPIVGAVKAWDGRYYSYPVVGLRL